MGNFAYLGMSQVEHFAAFMVAIELETFIHEKYNTCVLAREVKKIDFIVSSITALKLKL
jgi:hypothetical protein